jgi:uncharacterized protein involved in copper resistance
VELQPGRHDRGRRPAPPRHRRAPLARRATRTANARPRVVRRPARVAIFYRDLLELRHSDRAAIQAFADEAWVKARDPRRGLVHFGGRRPTPLDQAAMAQIYAELARAS